MTGQPHRVTKWYPAPRIGRDVRYSHIWTAVDDHRVVGRLAVPVAVPDGGVNHIGAESVVLRRGRGSRLARTVDLANVVHVAV